MSVERKPYEHDFYDRADDLSHCKVCGGAEGSLPTMCPGRKMTKHEEDQVYAGKLDYDRSGMPVVDDGGNTAFTGWWQPVPRGVHMGAQALSASFIDALLKDKAELTDPKVTDKGYDLEAGMLGTHVSAWFRETAATLMNTIPEGRDPLETPLPCDIKVGNCTIRKGVGLRSLVLRTEALHRAAVADDGVAVEHLRAILGAMQQPAQVISLNAASAWLREHDKLVSVIRGFADQQKDFGL